MDQIQNLSKEVQSLLTGNTTYQTYHDIYKFLLESYVGGEEYRRAGHLIRYQLETEREYQNRLYQTPLDNHCSSVISVFNSFLFRQPPERTFGAIEGMPEVEDFLKDADMDGRNLNSFMKDVATWAGVFGHCWVLCVKPFTGSVTRAEEQAQGVRPYVSYLTPLVVLDWYWKRNSVGKYELTYFKYLEEVTGDTHVIKEWTPYKIITTTVDVEHDTIDNVVEEVNGLGKIPAVICYNRKGIQRGIGVSDITDIAQQQKYIYNCYSEIMQSISMDTHPSLVTTPEVNVGTGSGALIHVPENINPGLKPYLLEFSGAGIDKILSAMTASIDSIDKMANTGSIRSTEARRMSGVAQQQEFELLSARLSEKADNIELCEEQIWTLFSEYMGMRWDGTIDYPGSFNIRDANDEIQQLKIASEAAGDDPVVRTAINNSVMDWLMFDSKSNKEEKGVNLPPRQQPYQPHTMMDPATGETRVAQTMQEHLDLAAQGWIHPNEGE